MTDKIVSMYENSVEDSIKRVTVMTKRVNEIAERILLLSEQFDARITRLEDKLLEMKLRE